MYCLDFCNVPLFSQLPQLQFKSLTHGFHVQQFLENLSRLPLELSPSTQYARTIQLFWEQYFRPATLQPPGRQLESFAQVAWVLFEERGKVAVRFKLIKSLDTVRKVSVSVGALIAETSVGKVEHTSQLHDITEPAGYSQRVPSLQ